MQVLIGAVEEADPGAGDCQAGYLRRRLVVAVVFFVPLSDLSVLLSLFPAYRFPGRQWVLADLTAPVGLWAAWPFHRSALKNARHGSCSMDTLVSLGIIAACGWSAYAMFFLDRGGQRGSALHLLIHAAAGGGIYLQVAASVTTFLLADRFFEARARRSAGAAMGELASAGAKDVCVLGQDGGGRWVLPARRGPGMVACGRGTQLGIFIKGCQALESSRSIDTVVLDKTGPEPLPRARCR